MPCLGFSRFHVTDNKSLLIDWTGGVPDASGPEAVQFLPLPVTPGLLDDGQCHVRFQGTVVLLRGKAAHCLQKGRSPIAEFAKFAKFAISRFRDGLW